MSLNVETVWRFQTKKFQKLHSSHGEHNKKITRPSKQKLNMSHEARKKLTEAKFKKAFRIKLFELFKTRTKKSSPDLFNVYVISAGHDMAIDAGRATTCRRNCKPHDYKQNVQKMKGLLKEWVLTGKKFEDFKQKTSKIPLFPRRTKRQNQRTPRAKTEHEPFSHEKINWSKFEKSVQNKFVRNLQD